MVNKVLCAILYCLVTEGERGARNLLSVFLRSECECESEHLTPYTTTLIKQRRFIQVN